MSRGEEEEEEEEGGRCLKSVLESSESQSSEMEESLPYGEVDSSTLKGQIDELHSMIQEQKREEEKARGESANLREVNRVLQRDIELLQGIITDQQKQTFMSLRQKSSPPPHPPEPE